MAQHNASNTGVDTDFLDRDGALIALTSLFIASLVTANLIGSKLVVLADFTISAGLLVFPFTCFAADLINEIYGARTTRKVVLVGLAIQVYVLLFVQLGAWLPAAPRRDLTRAYAQMYSLTPRMVLASITAYTVSQLTDVEVFAVIRRLTAGRHMWLRKNLSTFIGQAIDTAVFLAVFLGGVLPLGELAKAFVPAFGLKMIMAAIDTPLMYATLRFWKRNGPSNDIVNHVIDTKVTL
jgi:uncharacterized integral membrane protein (TIGR00697 family)